MSLGKLQLAIYDAIFATYLSNVTKFFLWRAGASLASRDRGGKIKIRGAKLETENLTQSFIIPELD